MKNNSLKKKVKAVQLHTMELLWGVGIGSIVPTYS